MVSREVPVTGNLPRAVAEDAPVLPHVPALQGADNRLAPGHVHAVSPEHGEPVTILPGELMPGWMRAELEAEGTLAVEGPGVFTLVPAKGRRK